MAHPLRISRSGKHRGSFHEIILEEKMVLKIYALIWVLGISAATILYLTGNLTPFMQVVFGLLTFAATFLGFLSVVPAVIFHSPTKH